MARYAAPDGNGTGTLNDPMSLAHAIQLSGETRLLPGRYAGDLSLSTIGLTLTSESGAIIDGGIDVIGPDITLQNLELCYTGWTGRISAQTGSNPTDLTLKRLAITGERARVLRCFIHDYADFGWWSTTINSELSGCLIYSNGWDAPDRGHGHGVYTQNRPEGRKTFRNCITWGHYSTCGKVYSATSAPLKHYDISGLICGPSGDSRFLIGSDDGSTEDVTVANVSTLGAALQFGDALVTSDITFHDCYIAHPTDIPLVLSSFNSLTGLDNVIIGGSAPDPSYRFICKIVNQGAWTLDRNSYHYTGPSAKEFRNEGVGDLTFAQWKAATGLDANSTIQHSAPATNRVLVQDCGNGRYHVAVWNWEGLASIPAPIAGTYTNVRNRAESVVLEAGDPLPMNGWSTVAPIGASAPIVDWDSRFQVFIVEAL